MMFSKLLEYNTGDTIMAKRITKTVYTLAELVERGDKRAIELARQWLREGATDYNWWEYVYEMWTTALEQIGFENPDISFSGFWSQGDGASFTVQHVELEKLIAFLAAPPEAKNCIEGGPEDFRPWLVRKCGGVRSNPKFARLLWIIDYLGGASVERTSHHYSHERTCSFNLEDLRDDGEWHSSSKPGEYGHWESYTPRVRKLYDDFLEAAEKLRLDLSCAIYKSLEEEYEYITSDESIDKMAEGNSYLFNASGNCEGHNDDVF